MLGRRVLGIGLAIATWMTVANAKDMALVSNKSNGVSSVSMPELVKICKGQTHRWSSGKSVIFFSLNPASAEMKMVLDTLPSSLPFDWIEHPRVALRSRRTIAALMKEARALA